MPRILFSGVAHPERAQISVNNLNSLILTGDGRQYAAITLNIWLNQITAMIETEESDIYALRNLVKREAEFITDLAGFISGLTWDVEITKVFDEALNATRVFGIDIPVLAERAVGRDVGGLVSAIFPLCFGPDAIYLRRCLSDLSFAMKRLDDTAFYCYRALESLRQSFGSDLPEREQWAAMAAAVNSTPEEMEPLRAQAFPARHGLPPPLTDAVRQRLFQYTWTVVERYIDYRLVRSGGRMVFASAPTGAL